MATYLYRNDQLEQDLLKKINDKATERYGGDIPADVRERIDTETRHIFGNGHGTRLAIAAAVAEYSAAHGYPVGVRGHIGDLLVSHLLGIAALDPTKLGLRWEGCLGPDGSRMPEIALNVAPRMRNAPQARLREILPGCDVLFGPGIPSWKTVIVPRESGIYDPGSEYLTIALRSEKLMGCVGKADGADIFDGDLIVGAYCADIGDLPVLGGWGEFLALASMLEPRTFLELVKVVGLASYALQFQAYRIPLLPDRFDYLVGTQEDIYDICVRLGIDANDAFRIMRQAVRGRLTQGYRDMLAAHGAPGVFLATLDVADHLHPRGQLADEIGWALMILAHRFGSCRV